MAFRFLGTPWLLVVLLHIAIGHAQVATSITSSGLGTTVVPQTDGITYNITGGTRPGNGPNLFHSFGLFSVGAGDVANFTNDSALATSNILGRINGGQASNIFGTIRTTDFGAANLFLINPFGWVFGPTASLEVGGSFHASTADYLRFSDNAQFFADPDANSVLTSAPPVAFGFLGPSIGTISLDGSFLQVPEGNTLSLVGGDVQITGGAFVAAPSGRVQIGSFASAGEAAIDGLAGAFASLGNVEISGSSISAADVEGDPAIVNGGTVLIRGGDINVLSAFIDASGTQTFDADFNVINTAGGAVVIRGGRLILDASAITSNTFGDVDGAGFEFALTESITLTNGSSINTIAAADFGFGLGRGGDIGITAPNVSVDASFITALTFGQASGGAVSFDVATLAVTGGGGVGSLGGNVAVNATQSVSISGRDSAGTPSSLFTSTEGPDAGRLNLMAPLLVMDNFGTITSNTFGGLGGEIAITVDRLSITGGANIDSHTGSTSAGGNVTVMVRESAVIAGVGSDGSPSGIFSDSCFGCTGRAGDITFESGTLTLTQGALIQSGSIADPQGGAISVSATTAMVISGGSGISTQADTQDVGRVAISAQTLVVDDGFISATTRGAARGGGVAVNVQTLNLIRGGQIASSAQEVTSVAGDGGSVTVMADSVSISGASPSGTAASPFLTDPSSGIFSTTRGPGNAGQITVTTPVLTVADGGKISVATTGAGAAGNVLLNVGNLALTGGARVDSSTAAGGAGGSITISGALSISGAGSGFFSTAASSGAAGTVTVTGSSVTLVEGGTIDSSTTAAGAGGAITVNGTLSIAGAGSGLFSTASSTGNAGAVNVTGPNLTIAGGGTIDSSTTGAGAGGAINLSAASQVEISSGGSVRADSLGAGNTGSITIAAGDRIIMEGGSISTRAATSDGGNITLLAPNLIRLASSQITTSVETGTGGGGNIFIDPQFVLLEGSSITANAFGGPGGNITIIAGAFLADATSVVTASSALSAPGTVEKPENNVAGEIAQLPKELVDASRLMQGACSARRAGAPSSFMVSGRGGVPVDPDGYLPSYSTSAAPLAGARGAAAGEGFALAMAGWDCWR